MMLSPEKVSDTLRASFPGLENPISLFSLPMTPSSKSNLSGKKNNPLSKKPAKDVKPKGSVENFFKDNPDLTRRLHEYLDKIPQEKKEENLQKFKKFIAGEMTWAEIKGYPKNMLKELARIAYSKYQMGDYRVAESLFKGLSIIDHINWYYRSALGAIYQKQKLYDQALEEYTISLSLNPKEIGTLTNRGECRLHQQDYKGALEDFGQAIALDDTGKNLWSRRAQAFRDHLIKQGHGESLSED